MKVTTRFAFFIVFLALALTGCNKQEEAVSTKTAEKPAPQAAEKQVKAGFVYVGPVGDGGWTYAHDQGRQAMEKLPFVKPSIFLESVHEGAEATRAITGLVNKGCNLVFTTSFGFMDATLEVAKKHPDTVFMHCSGYKTADNVGTYFGRMYQPRYLSGIIAGKMTKSNIIGYVGAFPIPEVIRGINAFALGVRSVNPKAVVKVVWTQTWFDPGVERDAADSLLDVGADVLTMHQDAPATLQAAEARGAYVIGYNSDMRKFAPNSFLTAPVWNWGALYTKVAAEVKDGTWKSRQIWWGMDKDLVRLAPLSDKVPADVKALVKEKTAAIVAGTLKPFAGPISGQDGKEVVAAGAVIADADLLGMNYFVAGVQGAIPK
ncbi:BMP family ABC transporter substrate-binding protein [Geothermobacter hydrogeniphilus]|uniref:BMP family ABC transporter substrate-binding protein n=1 Tax=Geothermobacter hydrogeniphilus TaxID=1969733 RepID=A0A2K2HDV6_9BACT|nr:BMP family ABC transporter substrate-binding protein [Geothermobacter hydrogeniphilus]PNU21485.1 BMP family ABC transporter substrate-binding protein [Geothermobacter hydrogeniphilus]